MEVTKKIIIFDLLYFLETYLLLIIKILLFKELINIHYLEPKYLFLMKNYVNILLVKKLNYE